MTERKPPDVAFETWVDRQIREAAERGEFDNLPGTGKPLPGLNKPHDELWWVKQKVQREGLSPEALLPTPLQLRKEIDRLPDTVGRLPSEQAVRDTVEELNTRIVDWLRAPSGPRIPVAPVDADTVVQQWRAGRQVAPPESTADVSTESAAPERRPSPLLRWWHRITRWCRASG